MSGNPIPTADFDWTNDDAIVCREQSSVAVYPSTRGGVVIRAERGWDEDSDTFIILQLGCIRPFLKALIEAAREACEGTGDDPSAIPDLPDLPPCTRGRMPGKPKHEPEQPSLGLGGAAPANGDAR